MRARALTPLTPMERRLLSLLALGQSSVQAAAAMRIDPADAEVILADLMKRHDVLTRQQLLARAIVHRWI
ncbi:MAG: hypothetical protein ACRYFS_11895 [Janthinobacterium lividum]